MARHRNLCLPLVFFSIIVVLVGCYGGPSVSGAFDRDYNVNGPTRLELTNASGDVDITASADGKVHVRGEVRASGFGFDNPQKRLDDTLANPPIEQRGDTVRIGKEMSRMRNVSIAYTIQVPRDTEVSATVASGAQTIRGVRGPVKVRAASGAIRVGKCDGLEHSGRCARERPFRRYSRIQSGRARRSGYRQRRSRDSRRSKGCEIACRLGTGFCAGKPRRGQLLGTENGIRYRTTQHPGFCESPSLGGSGLR